jgi:Rieske Fe-S protein
MNTKIQPSPSARNTMKDQTAGGNGAEEQINRRAFCNRLVMTSSGVLIGASALSSVTAQQLSQVAYPPLRIEGAEALMPGSALYFNYPTRRDAAILVRSQSGQYYAFSQKCSHRGCSVYFDRNRGSLECPCHRGAYDAQTGFVLNGPPTYPLDQIWLQMRSGGSVWAVGRTIGGGEHNA